LAVNQAHNMLYAANEATGTVDVFNSSFASLGVLATPTLIGRLDSFPFNVRASVGTYT
jgi:hypothetical protein